MKTRLLFLAALLAWACSRPAAFTPRELAVIEKSDSVMYVLTVADRADSAVLRVAPLVSLLNQAWTRTRNLWR